MTAVELSQHMSFFVGVCIAVAFSIAASMRW